jgi:hypothetical protein
MISRSGLSRFGRGVMFVADREVLPFLATFAWVVAYGVAVIGAAPLWLPYAIARHVWRMGRPI